ncbi:hypothetical protein PTKIN_Ptkin03bG0205300 [Pterospermum kingtungense]
MEKLFPRLFLFLVLALSNLNSRVYGGVTSEENTLADIDRKLKLLNKPAVKSIQMRPSYGFFKQNLATKNKSSEPVVFQTWRRSGSCPQGTVPIRRVRRQDLLRATSLEHFGRKPPPQIFSASKTNDTRIIIPPIANRSAAILLTTGNNYIGAKADINVWNPYVESPADFTTAQIWVKAGLEDNFESLESGWTVNPHLYGDKQTRFFVCWTTDAYKTSGCFDHTCSGFVQTSPDIALGGVLSPLSKTSGKQYQITLGIYMDPYSGNWWLHFGTNIVVGYWPARSLMTYLKQSATLVEWGGEVYSPNVKKTPHTKTAMGSGEFPSFMWGKASFISNARIVDPFWTVKYPDFVGTYADENNCYSTYNYRKVGAEPVFYFGGPGQDSLCP